MVQAVGCRDGERGARCEEGTGEREAEGSRGDGGGGAGWVVG